MQPTLVEIDSSAHILKEELFVPILYIIKFKVLILYFQTLDEAIRINNDVP